MAINTERGAIAHLLRRAGFSPSSTELDAAQAKGLDAVIDELLNPERVSDDAETGVPASLIDYARPQTLPLWWMARMVRTRRPLQEKMTLFWHGHLTSSLSRAGQVRFVIYNQNEFFRRNALGSFRELITGVSRDPAMILWLDNNTNRKGKPNENYARELFELFTLGRDQYTEGDIREAARAFTGWFQREGVFQFTPAQHDNDLKTIFGRTGRWDGTDVCAMAVEHPAAGPFIARKLWSFFAYRNPEQAIVDEIADVYYRSGFEIRTVMRAILTHRAFYSEKAHHALVKSPTELIAGFLRSLGAAIDTGAPADTWQQLANQLTGAAAAMGQTLFNPPNVGGWPGGQAWVSTTALISRYNFAAAAARNAYPAISIDPGALLARAGATSAAEVVEYFTDLLLDGDLTTAQRGVLLQYMNKNDNGTAGTFRADEPGINKKVRGLLHLIATAPQYQLA